MLSTIAWDELSLKNNYVHLQCFAIHIRNIVARVCYICKIPWHPWGHPNVPCCSEGAPKCPLLLRGGWVAPEPGDHSDHQNLFKSSLGAGRDTRRGTMFEEDGARK